MDILYTSLHLIDRNQANPVPIKIKNTSTDLLLYITNLINEINTSGSKRSFKFSSDTTEVRNSISQFLQGKYKDAVEVNAKRLLRIETKTQEKISQLQHEIPKGSLFQTIVTDDDFTRVVISKAEHSSFLDEQDFVLHSGLPTEKKVYKAFVYSINKLTNDETIYIFDNSTTMARYWWEEYFELCVTYTDSDNTKKALNFIDKKLFDPIKLDFPADHTILRNTMIGYFRNQSEFDLDKFVSNVLMQYDPVDPHFPRERCITTAQSLPQKYEFDSKFNIVKEEINKRRVYKLPLTDTIDLIFNDFIENLESIIIPETEVDGKKYIKIYSDKGYDSFKRKEIT